MTTTLRDWCGDQIDPELDTHSIRLERWAGGDPTDPLLGYDLHEACADAAMTALSSVMVERMKTS